MTDEERHRTEREAMARGMGGGWPGYLQRLREGHRPTFVKGRVEEVVYSGCTCGSGLCVVPHLLAHIDDCLAAYEAKVQDFATETLRGSAARAALRRALSPVMLAARLGEAPMFSGEFFDGGFPPDEREALETAMGDEWEALLRLRLEPGRHASRLHFTERDDAESRDIEAPSHPGRSGS